MRMATTAFSVSQHCCSGLGTWMGRRLRHAFQALGRLLPDGRRQSGPRDFQPHDFNAAEEHLSAIEWRMQPVEEVAEADWQQAMVDRVFDSWESFFSNFSDDPRDVTDRDQYLSIAGPMVEEAEREDRSGEEDRELAMNMLNLLLVFQSHRMGMLRDALHGARQELGHTTQRYTRATLERAHLEDELSYCQNLMQRAESVVHASPVLGAGDGRRLATRLYALVGALQKRRSRVALTPPPLATVRRSSANLRVPEDGFAMAADSN